LRRASAGRHASQSAGEALRRSHVEPWLAPRFVRPRSSTSTGPTEAVRRLAVCTESGRGDRERCAHREAGNLTRRFALVNGEPARRAGPGLARGYPRLPGATLARRFVPDPGRARCGAPLPHRRSLRRPNAQGLLWYNRAGLNRQLKIRGHRVETGARWKAVAAAPLPFRSVTRARASVRRWGEPAELLVGYVVGEGPARPDLEGSAGPDSRRRLPGLPRGPARLVRGLPTLSR